VVNGEQRYARAGKQNRAETSAGPKRHRPSVALCGPPNDLASGILVEAASDDGEVNHEEFRARVSAVGRGFLGIALAWTPAAAQQVRAVGGLIVNFGIVPAEVALGAAGHSEAHPLHPPSGSQHVLVTLDDEASHKRVGVAEVSVEVTDPHGRVEKKPLLHTQAGGLPDYSELFAFSWSGEYKVRVIITPQPGAKPLEALFTVHHTI